MVETERVTMKRVGDFEAVMGKLGNIRVHDWRVHPSACPVQYARKRRGRFDHRLCAMTLESPVKEAEWEVHEKHYSFSVVRRSGGGSRPVLHVNLQRLQDWKYPPLHGRGGGTDRSPHRI